MGEIPTFPLGSFMSIPPSLLSSDKSYLCSLVVIFPLTLTGTWKLVTALSRHTLSFGSLKQKDRIIHLVGCPAANIPTAGRLGSTAAAEFNPQIYHLTEDTSHGVSLVPAWCPKFPGPR